MITKEFPDLLAKRAYLAPSQIAMQEHYSGKSCTYHELNAAASRAGGLFAHLGVGDGDRVAILCRNRIEFFEALFAVTRIGAVLVPLNWRMPAIEVQSIIEDCDPKLILVGAEDFEKIETLQQDRLIIQFDCENDNYTQQCLKAPPLPASGFWQADSIWYLLYTSGTTGKPKAVMYTFQMAIANYINARQAIDLVTAEHTLNFLPLFHTAGINLYTLPFLFEGGKVTIFPGFDVEAILPYLLQGNVDVFFGVPACYQQISLHKDFKNADFSKVRNWGCGGAALPDIIISQFADQGAEICGGYGMTETGPTAFLMDKPSVQRKIGSAGKAQLLTDARIMTDQGVATTKIAGELQLKGPGITPGYWRNETATNDTFTDDGWLRTGDLAKFDDDGYAYIVGRSKEMFISGGENVYPAEVENVYAHHPAILECAVIGTADEKWGEVGKAYILLRENMSADAQGLIAFGRERLAAYKVPKSFIFVEDFPRTAAGKIQKHLLTQAPIKKA